MNDPRHETSAIKSHWAPIPIYKEIEKLRDSPICWVSILKDQDIEKLLDDLEESYIYAIKTFDEYITTQGELSLCDFYNFDEYLFPPDVYEEAKSRFWELITTSRFSVNSEPSVWLLQNVRSPNETITMRHIVALAVMACVKEAIDSLEWIEFWWSDATELFRKGRDFAWLTEHDANELDDILCFVYGYPDGTDPFPEFSNDPPESLDLCCGKIKGARDSLKQADLWSAHLATMNFSHRENHFSRIGEKFEKSEKAKAIAKKPRKVQTKNVTPELVAKRYNERAPGTKWEGLCADLAAEFAVSERTVSRRYKTAKEKNLLS